MSFDRLPWMDSHVGGIPLWQCPTCQTGDLHKITRTMMLEETGNSKRARISREGDSQPIEERFTCLLRCNFPNCGEIVTVVGTKMPEQVQKPDGTIQSVEWYTVDGVYPAPTPIEVRFRYPATSARP